MLRKLNKSAQSIPEYAVFLGVIVLAFIAMQTYIKRGLQGVVKVATDEIGLQKDSARVDPLRPEDIGELSSSQGTVDYERSDTTSHFEGGSVLKTYGSTDTGWSTSTHKTKTRAEQ